MLLRIRSPFRPSPVCPLLAGGAPLSPADVSANLTGLSPGTHYSYRLVVSNSNGDNKVGGSFDTVGHYQFTSDFGSAGSGDGQLVNPQDVAVDDSSGDVYVADTGNHRIVKFNSAGNFLAAWGWGVSDGNLASETCTLSCQAGISGAGAGQFATPTFIAVDNSSGPSAGDVYVADTADNVVQKFEPSGNLITSWGTGGATTYPGGISGIAIELSGALIVQPGSGNGIAVDSVGTIFTGSLAIDTSTDDRYYDQGTYIQRIATVGPCEPNYPYSCPPFDTFGTGDLNRAAGLTFDPANRVLYVANAGDNDLAVFSPRPLPVLTTESAANPGPTSVTLTGHLDPNGAGAVTDCHFEYGTDTTYSLGSVPCSPAPPLSNPTSVSATLSSLTPFTSYHFRLAATGTDDLGLFSYSRDRTFTAVRGSAPTIDATSASDLTPTTATLSAQVNPSFAPTIYRFQYGTDTSYGSQTVPGESIGEDGVDHQVSEAISGLRPATTYHFRVIAVNFNGPTTGPDQTFTTPGLPGVTAGTASNLSPAAASPPIVAPSPLTCKAGFAKRHDRCVKRHQRKPKHYKHKHKRSH